jgi:hypothetical protein
MWRAIAASSGRRSPSGSSSEAGAFGAEGRSGGPRRAVPGYREALIETAVCLNAAQAAFDLRQDVERAGKW